MHKKKVMIYNSDTGEKEYIELESDVEHMTETINRARRNLEDSDEPTGPRGPAVIDHVVV